MLRAALLIGIAAMVPLPAEAGDITAESTIESVTVFPQGAGITRRVPVSLPAGDSTVILPDLPAETEVDSLTVSGTADQAIAIRSVETRVVPAGEESDPRRQELLDRIERIEDRITAIGDRVAALEGRRDFIGRLAEALPEGFSRALVARGAGVESWTAASAAIGDDLAKVAEAIQALKIEERQLDADLDKARTALDELPPPRDHVAARIALAADAPAAAVLTVSYRVPSARWVPAYDAELATGDNGGAPRLVLVRRAEVTQATGEDWTGVALTLSTARPAGGTAAPEPEPFLVAFAPDYDSFSASDRAAGAVAAPAAPVPESAAEAGEADKPVTMVEAAVDFGDFQASYRVPGAVSVESGVGARALRIASETVEAALEVRASPALVPSAFLHARFAAPAEAPLLAGRVALFRDGAFVGSGAIGFTNPGRDIVLGFGLDDRVRVTRTPLDRETGSTGLLSARTTDTRRFRIAVENLHKQAMTVTVYDRVPYAEDERITVERLPEATAPTAADVDDRRGVLAWSYLYQPGESRDIENAYRISWPADESVVLAD
jgi:uncharacterized protein (TIGR02231 family)